MVEINLLDDRRRQVVARQSVARKTTLISVVVVVTSLFVTFLSVAYHQFENSRESALESRLTTIQKEVADFRYALESQWLLSHKLGLLEEIWGSRQYRAAKLDIFEQLATNPVMTVRQTNFGNLANSTSLEIQATVADRTDAETVFAQLDSLEQAGQVSAVTLDSLSRSPEGTFRIAAQLSIPKLGNNEKK